jgi:hypothetical protein
LELVVRNTFKILGCHERDVTIQKSIGKAIFTVQKGAHQILESKYTGRGIPLGFYL